MAEKKKNWDKICRTAHSPKVMSECYRRGYMPEPGFEFGALKKKRRKRKKK